MDDIIINKVAVIERCLGRIREEYQGDSARLEVVVIQDSIVLNLQRACEASIDLAMHLVARRRLGVPQDSRDAFAILERAGVIEAPMAARLKAMVGFRNIAVHDYQSLQLPILRSILDERLGDFIDFTRAVRSHVH